MGKMIAVLEVEFESDDMWDKDALKSEMGGDWFKAMSWLYENDDIGIFSEPLKLVEVKPASTKPITKEEV